MAGDVRVTLCADQAHWHRSSPPEHGHVCYEIFLGGGGGAARKGGAQDGSRRLLISTLPNSIGTWVHTRRSRAGLRISTHTSVRSSVARSLGRRLQPACQAQRPPSMSGRISTLNFASPASAAAALAVLAGHRVLGVRAPRGTRIRVVDGGIHAILGCTAAVIPPHTPGAGLSTPWPTNNRGARSGQTHSLERELQEGAQRAAAPRGSSRLTLSWSPDDRIVALGLVVVVEPCAGAQF